MSVDKLPPKVKHIRSLHLIVQNTLDSTPEHSQVKFSFLKVGLKTVHNKQQVHEFQDACLHSTFLRN